MTASVNARPDGGRRQLAADRLTILSGGQTGVDRGALDAALAADAPCGGWCPAGRAAEDGPIPERYPVRELSTSGYDERTRRNVEDSDGTVILMFGPPTGGTASTIGFSRRLGKAHLIIDAPATSIEQAGRLLSEFVRRHHVRRLNVAGPRASDEAGGYEYARQLIGSVLRSAGRGRAGDFEAGD